MLPIEFRPVTHADLPMLKTWLERPHWREWWGEPTRELEDIVEMVDGRDTTEPYIFYLEGRAAGYIQCWHIEEWQDAELVKQHPWLAELPEGATGIDISIAEAGDLGRGLGTAVLKEFVALLRARGHTTIIIDPDPANTRAVRAYTKAGFKPIPHLDGRYPGVLLMQHEGLQ